MELTIPKVKAEAARKIADIEARGRSLAESATKRAEKEYSAVASDAKHWWNNLPGLGSFGLGDSNSSSSSSSGSRGVSSGKAPTLANSGSAKGADDDDDRIVPWLVFLGLVMSALKGVVAGSQ
jgi:hypothetical protein